MVIDYTYTTTILKCYYFFYNHLQVNEASKSFMIIEVKK